MTNENRCGFCNYDIPEDHASNNYSEEDGTVTRYHFGCGAKPPEACPDCGHHRKVCDECKEL